MESGSDFKFHDVIKLYPKIVERLEEAWMNPGLVHEHQDIEDGRENVEIVPESDQKFH